MTKKTIPKNNKLELTNTELSQTAPVICSKCLSQINAKDLTNGCDENNRKRTMSQQRYNHTTTISRSEKQKNSNENYSKGMRNSSLTNIVFD